MKNIQKYLAIGGVLCICFFNIYLHSSEISIKGDVNDNIFQYALVDEAKNIWHNVVAGKQSIFHLVDSSNGRWNEGFALSNYYAHMPQAVISGIGLVAGIDTKTLFNFVKFMILVLLPLSFFVSSRILGLSYTTALVSAFVSHAIFTDGLYGIDVTSYLWRGWGLSSQLFGVFIAPFALAYTYQFIASKKYLWRAVIFNFLLAQNHMGIFFILGLSYPLLLVAKASCLDSKKIHALFKNSELIDLAKRMGVVGLFTGLFLSYVFAPFFLQGAYRNFSLWDPIWKFDSFGLLQTVMWVLNGDLFDFGRLPIVSYLVLFGVLYVLSQRRLFFRYLGLSYCIFLLFFIGRKPFGFIIDLVPGMSEFHLHRFIVGLHIFGVFIVVLFSVEMVKRASQAITRFNKKNETHIRQVMLIFMIGIISVIVYMLEKPIITYSQTNKTWINESNVRYGADEKEYAQLVRYLKKSNVGRVYAGRPGNWGRQFKVGDTTVYMALSRDGFWGIAFAPESWSPMAEYDQFFDESDANSYDLFNVTHVVADESVKMPDFAKKVETFGKYIVYKIQTNGWFEFGTSSNVITGGKADFVNITHLWMTTNGPKNKEFPQVSYTKKSNELGKNEIDLHDKHSYTFRGKINRLGQENPLFDGHDKQVISAIKKSEEKTVTGFKTVYEVDKDCPLCVVVLKQTFHPNWSVKVNGIAIDSYPVFPFYSAIPVQKAGTYTIEAEYKPNGLKILLLTLSLVGVTIVIVKKSLIKKT